MSQSSSVVRRTATRITMLSGAALAAALVFSGCSAAPAPTDTGANSESTKTAAAAFELTDGWAKSGDGMTGVFGTLTNSGAKDLTLVSVASPAAKDIQLHETVTSGSTATMREIEGGFVIPAGGSFELVPGGNHIMFMDMPKPLVAGEEVELTLTFDDGSVGETSVLVKDYAGAQENYEDMEGMGEDASSMDHDGSSDTSGMTEGDSNE